MQLLQCAQCRRNHNPAMTAALGPCRECGMVTNSVFKLCEACSLKLDQCQYCRKALSLELSKMVRASIATADKVLARQKARSQRIFDRAVAAFKDVVHRHEDARAQAAAAQLSFKDAHEAAMAEWAARYQTLISAETSREDTAGIWQEGMADVQSRTRPLQAEAQRLELEAEELLGEHAEAYREAYWPRFRANQRYEDLYQAKIDRIVGHLSVDRGYRAKVAQINSKPARP